MSERLGCTRQHTLKRLEQMLDVLEGCFASAETAVRTLRLQERQSDAAAEAEESAEDTSMEQSTDTEATESRNLDSSLDASTTEQREGNGPDGPSTGDKGGGEYKEASVEPEEVTRQSYQDSMGALLQGAEHELRLQMSQVLGELEATAPRIHSIIAAWKVRRSVSGCLLFKS